MEIWRIDQGQKSLSRELVKAEWERQGGRISIGGKSPLTGGIKEAKAGERPHWRWHKWG